MSRNDDAQKIWNERQSKRLVADEMSRDSEERGISESWVIPAGDGNSHVVCEGEDPHRPGRILFVVRPPMGTRDVPSYEQLAEYVRLAVTAVNNFEALKQIADAAQAYMNFLERSVNVGPLTKNPTKEAAMIRNLRAALAPDNSDKEGATK